MGRKLVMVLYFRERLNAKLGGGDGNNLAVLSHICSGLADVSQYLYMARFYCTIYKYIYRGDGASRAGKGMVAQ